MDPCPGFLSYTYCCRVAAASITSSHRKGNGEWEPESLWPAGKYRCILASSFKDGHAVDTLEHPYSHLHRGSHTVASYGSLS